MSPVREGAAWTRAVASLRARPTSALVAVLGLFLAGVMVGAAVTLGVALSTGFDRAQQAAHTPDVTARFDLIERSTADGRISGIANLRSYSFRLVQRSADFRVAHADHGDYRYGRAELNGVEPTSRNDGLAIVAGRGLSGKPGEALIERGLADEWHIGPGREIGMRTDRGTWSGTIVGVTVEPDNVAYPLASQPRIYLNYDELQANLSTAPPPATHPVNAAYLNVVNPDRLPETLVQARTASFGLTGTTFATRSGVLALIQQAGGLVVALLTAFAAIAMLSAAAMLAAASHARVTRDLPTIGALRSLGFTPRGLAGSYALEAAFTAIPAVGLGIIAGALIVAGPTGRLLGDLNELAPAAPLGLLHLAALAVTTLLASVAAGWPALAAARRPVVQSLGGATLRRPKRAMTAARPIALGARLALRRPGRLAVSVLSVAASVATVFLMLALGRFLLNAEREPAALGERYSLLVDGGEGVTERVRATPGVAAAANRYEVRAVDAFDLGEPIKLVAFGEGREAVFPGRPLISGRRFRGPDEAEVGRGLAQSLGLAVGSRLIAQLEGGGEVRLRVSGILQELANDGRVAYVDPSALLRAKPDIFFHVATRAAPDISISDLKQRLEEEGLHSDTNGGLATNGGSFVGTIVALLRAVAGVNGLVCAALVLLALIVLARERSETIGILRATGGAGKDVRALLFGAGAVLVTIAIPVGYLLERTLLGPALSRIVDRYGALPLGPNVTEVIGVALVAIAVAAATAALTARRYVRQPVVRSLRGE